MVREIEKTGMPVVQLCNLVPIAKTVGANRIVPTISIPYPLGDPADSREEQYRLRRNLVGRALEAFTAEIDQQTVF